MVQAEAMSGPEEETLGLLDTQLFEPMGNLVHALVTVRDASDATRGFNFLVQQSGDFPCDCLGLTASWSRDRHTMPRCVNDLLLARVQAQFAE